jgi:hypothetical protein
MDSSGSGWGHMVGICEHSNEPLGSIKCRKFLDQPRKMLAAQGLCTMELVS